MPTLTWTEKMSVGNAQMDAQHKQIVDLLNLFTDGMGTKHALGSILSMICYADSHFRDEEALLARVGFPELDHQRREHHAFLARAQEFANERLDDEGMHVRLGTFLARWLTHHILTEDMKYKPYVAARPNGQT